MRATELNESIYPELGLWWESGHGRSSYTVFTSKTGELSVYVRRNVHDKTVMEVANVSSLDGAGGIRALYKGFLADIPAIAENILNPQLDDLLARWGWDHAYYDLGGMPTRVNKAFQKRFPRYREARSVYEAMKLSRESGASQG